MQTSYKFETRFKSLIRRKSRIQIENLFDILFFAIIMFSNFVNFVFSISSISCFQFRQFRVFNFVNFVFRKCFACD